MGKCPYCDANLHIKDFFQPNPVGVLHTSYETNQEKIDTQRYGTATMWVCPNCDKILGFSERDSYYQ